MKKSKKKDKFLRNSNKQRIIDMFWGAYKIKERSMFCIFLDVTFFC